ncbi:uncharacterized protein PITG_17099 [Phytophthora infestans T30-4]|uniref:Uncharacterized protein n=1 Tax=Phytophthora infestans (strain T30-4) TaxID=403677 RepID=D0NV10_PHYIT|nr:uncharacterized protein PITG_17099 [Phytophthora infestans T30-4]EEY66482.1 conserved hypothetical protein [Phytophthora infestans T30-4]|eukprot:XP_002897001.1 conserved hypothetical protein [Phytophthora infestans T30-4]
MPRSIYNYRLSPFDSAPWTLHPVSSICTFNVRIGSTQGFNISHDYDFRQFADKIAKISLINGDLTPELVNGLLDYQTWSLINRCLIADGTNAGCQKTKLIVLVVSEQELTYNRLTGEVLDFTTPK